jgi:dihydrofolate reductase
MAKLSYAAITSLDGFVNDESGGFGWAAPDEQVHAFVNDLERPVGTYLYGRRMYDVMQVWETMPVDDEPPEMQDYAQLWRAAEKVVYSTTLKTVAGARTRLESRFDPAGVRALKAAATADLSIGGPHLAAHALRAGLVDELHQFVNPVIVGGGTYWLPSGLPADLELLDEFRFANGVVHVHYRVRNEAHT